jgi:hypothetical protein
MKRIAVALVSFFFLTTPSLFANVNVVVGDDNPAVYGADITAGTFAQSGAQAFTLNSPTLANRIDLGFDTGLLGAGSSGVYPFTIHIANGLNPGSSDLLTLNENILLPTNGAVATYSYTFPPIYLSAGTYYLILTSTQPAGLFSLIWSQNLPGGSSVGSLGSAYNNNGGEFGGWQLFAPFCSTSGTCTTGTMAFDLDFVFGPVHALFGASLGQSIRLLVGPGNPPPGVGEEVALNFVDINGNPIGTSTKLTLNQGEIAWLDFNADQFVKQLGQRVEVQPVVTLLSNTTGPPPPSTVEVFDQITGFSSVLVPAVQVSAAPTFIPQALAGLQTMRLNVVAYPPGPAFPPGPACVAQLSFADSNGNPLGPSTSASLTSGMASSLDFDADTVGLKLGQRIEVLPVVSVTPTTTTGPPVASVCGASVEVFDHITGRTETYQAAGTALPAVQ